MHTQKLQRLQNLLDEMVETSYVAGVNLLVLQNGQEQCYFEAGYKDLLQQSPLKRDTIFFLYSMSKPITAAAIMRLMEEGKIDLLDSVSKYIPTFKNQMVAEDNTFIPTYRELTIKDLLSMTSGLVYGGTQTLSEKKMDKLFEKIKSELLLPTAYTTFEVASSIGEIPLQFQPGSHWQYGTSADILGAIVEKASDTSFGSFLEANFFKPLGMTDTGFYVPEHKRHRLSKVYKKTNNELTEFHENHLGISLSMTQYPAFESGGAGLVSTIDDYSKFATMLLNQGTYDSTQILAPQTVHYMTHCHLEPHTQKDVNWDSLAGYSYGNLMRIMIDEGLAVFNGTTGEYGWDGWLGTYFMNDPVHNLTVLLMQQLTDSGTTSYTRKIRNIIASSL